MPTLHKAYIHSMHDSPISSVCANAIAFKYVLANVLEKKNVYTMHTIFFSFSLTSICIISRLKVVVRRVNVFLTTWICANASDNKIGSIEDVRTSAGALKNAPPFKHSMFCLSYNDDLYTINKYYTFIIYSIITLHNLLRNDTVLSENIQTNNRPLSKKTHQTTIRAKYIFY